MLYDRTEYIGDFLATSLISLEFRGTISKPTTANFSLVKLFIKWDFYTRKWQLKGK